MKRKLTTTVLIAAMLIIALAATALAVGLRRTVEADALAQAREALMRDYGLTQETLGCFLSSSEAEGDGWIVTFHGAAWELERLGDYTVVIQPGKPAETSWTHDDVDPALWQGDDMASPAWGQQQILARLRQGAEDRALRAETDWSNLSMEEEAALYPTFWGTLENTDNLTVRFVRTMPGDADIQPEEAMRLGKQAIIDAYGISEEALDGYAPYITFAQPENGGTRRYLVRFSKGESIYRPTLEYQAFTTYIASPSGETLFLEWNIESDKRTLPEGPLDGYDHAVAEFMREGSLRTRSAAEKADIVQRVKAAGLGDLIDPDAPYAMPGEADIPEADALARANEALQASFDMSTSALTLFDTATSLLALPDGRVWEIEYIPSLPDTLDMGFWMDIVPKMGEYTVRLDAKDATLQSATWSLQKEWTDVPYTENNWATAPIYHGRMLDWMQALREATDAIWAKYPENAIHLDFTLEDAAAYDTLFRNAGFDGFYRAMPRPDDLSYDEAKAIVQEALLADLPNAKAFLDTAVFMGNYSIYDPDAPGWYFSVYFVDTEGIEISYGITIDAATGDIRYAATTTGGNG